MYFYTILIRFVLDTVLEFEEHSYSIKLSCNREGTVFKFKALKTAVNSIEKDIDLEFEKQPESTVHFSKKEYPFNGNYSLEYVPGRYLPIYITYNIFCVGFLNIKRMCLLKYRSIVTEIEGSQEW